MAITRKQENPGGNGVLLPNGQRLFLRKPDGEVNPVAAQGDDGSEPEASSEAAAPGLKLSPTGAKPAQPTVRASFAQFGSRLAQPSNIPNAVASTPSSEADPSK